MWGRLRDDNFVTFMCRLSSNLGASTSWNAQGLSRPVDGLIYLYLYLFTFTVNLTLLLVYLFSCPFLIFVL